MDFSSVPYTIELTANSSFDYASDSLAVYFKSSRKSLKPHQVDFCTYCTVTQVVFMGQLVLPKGQ